MGAMKKGCVAVAFAIGSMTSFLKPAVTLPDGSPPSTPREGAPPTDGSPLYGPRFRILIPGGPLIVFNGRI